jgi:hypothetical protein
LSGGERVVKQDEIPIRKWVWIWEGSRQSTSIAIINGTNGSDISHVIFHTVIKTMDHVQLPFKQNIYEGGHTDLKVIII